MSLYLMAIWRTEEMFAMQKTQVSFNLMDYLGQSRLAVPETPDFKSRYCSEHKSQACDLQSCEEVDDELDVASGPTLRLHQQKQSAGSPIAEMILAKKTTRKQTYYQVLPCVAT